MKYLFSWETIFKTNKRVCSGKSKASKRNLVFIVKPESNP